MLPLEKLNLGIVHFMAYPQTIKGEGPVLETLRAIIEDRDFSFIEVTHIEDKGVRAEAAAMLKESGKRYAYGAQPCLLTRKQDLNSANFSERQAAVDTVKRSIDEAVEIGAEGLAFLSGKNPGPDLRASAVELLQESVTAICRHARSANPGLKILLESFDRVPFGKNALIGPTSEAVAFAETIRTEFPGFSLMLDLSHLPMLGEDSETALKLAKKVLGHIHIGNCVIKAPGHPAYGDEHPSFGIEAGENGVAELAEFLNALEKIGYLAPGSANPVSFEVKPMAGEDSAGVVAAAKTTLRQAWKTLNWPES